MIEAQVNGDRRTAVGQSVIDAAVHDDTSFTRARFSYLSPYRFEHVQQAPCKGPGEACYPTNSLVAARLGMCALA